MMLPPMLANALLGTRLFSYAAYLAERPRPKLEPMPTYRIGPDTKCFVWAKGAFYRP